MVYLQQPSRWPTESDSVYRRHMVTREMLRLDTAADADGRHRKAESSVSAGSSAFPVADTADWMDLRRIPWSAVDTAAVAVVADSPYR